VAYTTIACSKSHERTGLNAFIYSWTPHSKSPGNMSSPLFCEVIQKFPSGIKCMWLSLRIAIATTAGFLLYGHGIPGKILRMSKCYCHQTKYSCDHLHLQRCDGKYLGGNSRRGSFCIASWQLRPIQFKEQNGLVNNNCACHKRNDKTIWVRNIGRCSRCSLDGVDMRNQKPKFENFHRGKSDCEAVTSIKFLPTRKEENMVCYGWWGIGNIYLVENSRRLRESIPSNSKQSIH